MARRTTARNPEQLPREALPLDEESAWLFVLRSLSARSQSQIEIERKLAAKGASVAVIESAIERAAGYGYLDDASLAGQLARGMLSRGYGRRRAEQWRVHRRKNAGGERKEKLFGADQKRGSGFVVGL